MPLRAGVALGQYRLVEVIDGGGNADVWRATSDEHGDVALKVLRTRNPDSEPWQRFAREAAMQRQLTEEGFLGILPALTYHVPKRGEAGHAWLAMPLAEGATSVFGAKPDLGKVIAALERVARTLAALHARGIGHRDVKPKNVFLLSGEWVISDFGLIQVPDAETITQGSRGPGSLYYIAPELIMDRDAPAAPADVFSLAKTVWVLGSGQRYPPPGELRVEVAGLRLSSYSAHPRAAILDSLLQAATIFDPQNRPDMTTFAAELVAWLEQPRTSDSAPADLSAVAREITAIVAPDVQLQERENKRRAAMAQALSDMERASHDLPGLLRGSGVSIDETHHDLMGMSRYLLPPGSNDLRALGIHEGRGLSIVSISGRREPRGYQCFLQVGIAAFRILDHDELILAAGYLEAYAKHAISFIG
jgi:serine/threonine protein kinase